MTELAMKLPVLAIISATGLGTVLLAETTPSEYATPGVIIATLFAFIGSCSVILYKVVLAPLFAVFIKNLENAEHDRSKYLTTIIEMNKQYGENLTIQNQINARTEKMLLSLTRYLRTRNLHDGNDADVPNEASVPVKNRIG